MTAPPLAGERLALDETADRLDAKGRKVRVHGAAVTRALACQPFEVPLWPGQDALAEAAAEGWQTPIPISREAGLPAFPVHVLPPWLGEYVATLAVATQTPVDLPAILAIGALSTAAGGRVWVQVRRGWVEPLNLYLSVAMDPGNRKTPVFQAITAPLWEVDRELARAMTAEIVEAAARRNVAETAAAAVAREAATARANDKDEKLKAAVVAAALAESIAVPAHPRLLADDATPEALASLMAAQGGRIAVLSDEGGVFDLIAGRYNNGQPNLDLYLKAWSGTSYLVDRKGRPPEVIDRPALTMALAVQPDVLRTIAGRSGFRGRGLLPRFLYALPASPLGRRIVDPPTVPDEIERPYRDNLAALVRSLATVQPDAPLPLDVSAAALLHDFQSELEPRLAPTGDLASIADWASKLAGQLVRVAALIHLAAHLADGWYRPVDADAMGAALELGAYLIAHALAVFDLMGADPLTDDAAYALRWLSAHDRRTFTARDLYTANRTRFPTADAVTPVLDHLEVFGWIRPHAQPRPTGKPGRPPSPAWELHPRACP